MTDIRFILKSDVIFPEYNKNRQNQGYSPKSVPYVTLLAKQFQADIHLMYV